MADKVKVKRKVVFIKVEKPDPNDPPEDPPEETRVYSRDSHPGGVWKGYY